MLVVKMVIVRISLDLDGNGSDKSGYMDALTYWNAYRPWEVL
jgi:hypothetical protein